MSSYNIGSIVKFRGREWVVVPPGEPDLLHLRPLAGSGEDSCGIYLPAEEERPEPSVFPLPSIDDIGDFESARLLHDASRLLLRYGAGPFRSMGHLSFRPRPYQLVPLIMALRMEPVRMLIADDVGVGKTIEAALVAREMLDRGMAKRLAVICPPYLCDQWRRELYDKFSIDATVIRSESFARLERNKPRPDESVFKYYPHIVLSVDFVKSARYKYRFLEDCPDLVIVDEAHGCAKPAGQSVFQQQRHQLLSELASYRNRHLLLVTATPHSGVEESFISLLGLIDTRFGELDMDNMSAGLKSELVGRFIQRRRADVERWMDTETPFPNRDSIEAPYKLSPEYKKLFDDIYRFARQIVFSTEGDKTPRQRVRYWAALALLRCVMSSPSAAAAALEGRAERSEGDEENSDTANSQLVFDSGEVEFIADIVPTHTVSLGSVEMADGDKRKLQDYVRRARSLPEESDTKLNTAISEVKKLLKAGFRPIIFCRFIATADYVADQIQKKLSTEFRDLHVISVTGEMGEELREAKVEELCKSTTRVLVSTDCLSEGINLQEGFNAIVHYDLPWNPNRLEQREGRVDRFGQSSKVVKTVLIYGEDNPIDGAVLRVLLRKAREIHKRLGIMVPLPVDSESVMNSVMKALFKEEDSQQLRLFELTPVIEVNKLWDKAEERERKSRTIFAQHAIKPDEVAKELDAVDKILGDAGTVERFIKTACQRLEVPLTPGSGWFLIEKNHLPEAVKSKLPGHMTDKIAFDQPVPEGVTYISRTHPLTSALAEHLLDNALNLGGDRLLSSRCGVLKASSVDQVTSLFLLRLRYLVEESDPGNTSMAEECILQGFNGIGIGSATEQLPAEEALTTWEKATPATNMTTGDKKHWGSQALETLPQYKPALEQLIKDRSQVLYDSYERVRKAVKGSKVKIRANPDVDVLSMAVIVPQR